MRKSTQAEQQGGSWQEGRVLSPKALSPDPEFRRSVPADRNGGTKLCRFQVLEELS